MARSAVRTALVPLAWLALAPACAVRRAPAHAELATVAAQGDALALADALAATRPDVLENHLRLAEAYVALGDPVPAEPHLCRCLAHATALRPDDQLLLARIAASAGPFTCADQPSAAGR